MASNPFKRLLKHAGYLVFANLPDDVVFKRLCSMTVEKEGPVRVRKNFLVVSNRRSL